MKTVFADTFLWLALVDSKDAWHQRAKDFLDGYSGRLALTNWVLMELGDALAGSARGRQEFVSLSADLQNDPEVKIVKSDALLLEEAVTLYRNRLDKQWSLTDCTSFVIMQREGISEALTGDHHFEQAGSAQVSRFCRSAYHGYVMLFDDGGSGTCNNSICLR